MKKVVFLILTCLLCLGLFSGCAGDPGSEYSRIITDGQGRTVAVPDQVASVVCVGVGALRYTCYMGGAELVIGVEDYETKATFSRLYNYVHYQQFQDLPVIGTNGQPDAEQILSLSPQVIILSASAGVDADDLQKKTGIPVVVIPGSDTTLDQGAYDTIRILGQLLGKEDRAAELTDYLQQLQTDLQTRTADVENRPTVYIGGVSYKGSHGLEGTEAGYGPLALIHADNLADTTGLSGAFTIDVEQVLQWDPDVIFLDCEGLSLVYAAYAQNPDWYNSLTAVQTGRVYCLISFRNYASNLETALADAYYAGWVLYPEQFADIDPEQKTREIFQMLLGADPYDDLKEAGYEFGTIDLGASAG